MNEIEVSRQTLVVQDELPGVTDERSNAGLSRLSPKRPSVDTAGLADVFPYYAGFSYEWARGLLAAHRLPDTSVILDPWNGSGTTTLAARHEGFTSIGIDRNPVANIVARLRANAPSCSPPRVFAHDLLSPDYLDEDDPLQSWFDSTTAKHIRRWTTTLGSLSRDESSLGYVALFRAIRNMTKVFEGSNPTWVRRAKSVDELISVPAAEFDRNVIEEQQFLASRIDKSPRNAIAPMVLATASSSNLPIAPCSVDVTITSPPYLTRIDYAVAYTRELAVLGIDTARDRSLRSALMGTTLIRQEDPSRRLLVGDVAAQLLKDISKHGSKASNGYYRKQAQQYLADLTSGLNEITRVSKTGSVLHLVVQDSYYKEVPIRLAEICTEETTLRGWKLVESIPHPVRRTLTSLNSAARKYKKSEVAETVITLEKTTA